MRDACSSEAGTAATHAFLGKRSSLHYLAICQCFIASIGQISIRIFIKRLSLIQKINIASVTKNSASERKKRSLYPIKNPVEQQTISEIELIIESPK
jgi:hypothetical protein